MFFSSSDQIFYDYLASIRQGNCLMTVALNGAPNNPFAWFGMEFHDHLYFRFIHC